MGTITSALSALVGHLESVTKLIDMKVLWKLQRAIYINLKDSRWYSFEYQNSRWLCMER